MSVEAWEGMQRQGQDIAERFSSFAQSFSCLLQSHMGNPEYDNKSEEQGIPRWPWPWQAKRQGKSFDRVRLSKRRTVAGSTRESGGLPVLELGKRLGQVGADVGACVGGIVQNVVQNFPRPFQHDDDKAVIQRPVSNSTPGHMEREEDNKAESWVGHIGRVLKGYGPRRQSCEPREDQNEFDDMPEEDAFTFQSNPPNHFHKRQGSVTVSTIYDSRTQDIRSSIVARGDLWRAEASHGGSSSGNAGAPPFLLQLGPILFVRDTTLLLPVHLSKQHFLWYGFDRKNGLHSLCPAVWSKHRRWLYTSVICLNPLACSFMDLQFPHGQLTYVAGEGLNSSAFFLAFGGLLQVQHRYPGETKLSFTCKNRWGTRMTPTVQWPDKSFSVGMVQPLAWQRSGLMVQPTIQLSVTPTFGGRNAGWKAELIQSVKDKLSIACGCAFTVHPTAFASVSLGRSKWNGHSGSSGVDLRVECPLENMGRASFTIQLNSGLEF